MKKKELLDFITKVKNKALNSVDAKYSKLIQEKETELLTQYKTRIDEVQKEYNKANSKLTVLMGDLKEDTNIGLSYAYSLLEVLNNSSKIEEKLKQYSTFHGCDLLIKQRDKELNDVRDNYNKVWHNASLMGSAKEIATFLKELGFDISSVEEKEITALVSTIDKTKLFVCGENK